MRLKTILLTALMVLSLAGTAFAQQNIKIGYANIEAILLYMPETKSMNQQITTFREKLAQDLQNRQAYAQTKLAEYQETMQAGGFPTEAAQKAAEDELVKLDQEIQQKAAESDQKLMAKRQDLMAPIIEKVQKQIKSLAADEGYTYILNTVDGAGVSIVLHGPENDDVTEKLMTRLGIEIPNQSGK
ncbi:MAG: OmpH family outer membrane protein [Bacteroidota bacterium]